MATGLLKGGVDLDTLLMARVNAKRADVGIRVAGVDISNRFEVIGSGTPIANTGFRSAGVDIATMFRNIGEPLLTHTLTAGFTGDASTNFTGYGVTLMGAITPTTFAGVTINSMMDFLFTGVNRFQVEMPGSPPQNLFSSIVINGQTRLSSAATFNIASGVSSWVWMSQPVGLVSGNVYPVVMS